jgi:hypothetical protein
MNGNLVGNIITLIKDYLMVGLMCMNLNPLKKDNMKVGVIGSRGFNDNEKLTQIMDEIEDVHLIVSGGAKGADLLGEKWANENGVETLIFKPNWSKYGKRAGFIRNEDIVKNSDYIIAFWDGNSKGTENSINLAKKLNIPIKIINY